MGIKKAKPKAKKSSGVLGKVKSAIGGKLGLSGKKSSSGMRRRSRLTPEKLARQILILKLKRKLYRLKYGGR